MRESFSLANMIPQAPANNRGLWAHLEAAVRKLALAEGEAFVISGPIFDGKPKSLHGRVWIPARLFKAVLVPGKGAAGYVVDNAKRDSWRAVPIAELEELIGFKLFPGAHHELAELALPAPGAS
jgi:endonuclease G